MVPSREMVGVQAKVQNPRDHVFMQVALSAAERAAAAGEVPVGALVVCGGEVVASAHNAVIALSDPTAHAEIVALREAGRLLGNYRLTAATLYVTVEPCVMCVGALIHARIARVVYGCSDPKGGALGGLLDLTNGIRWNHHIEVTGGVAAMQAAYLLQEFFRARRGA